MDYIKELAKNGFFVEPSVASKIAKISLENFNLLMSKLKKLNLVVIDNSVFQEFFKQDIKIINEFRQTEKFSVRDYVKMLNERYDFIKEILMKKVEITNLLSINKASSGKMSVIGFVKDKEERGDNCLITIEDPTGEIQTVVPKNMAEKVNLDDVIAVLGNINNKIFFAEKILFPDIPLGEANYSSEPIKIAFSEKNVKADYIINKNSVKDIAKDKTLHFSEPILLEIAGVKILFALDLDPSEILRRRFIHKGNADFLIDVVPDIVFNNKNINANYKGTSITSENVLVNLSTRETTLL
jgi:hypothetical protein